jgi:hypothetical protein
MIFTVLGAVAELGVASSPNGYVRALEMQVLEGKSLAGPRKIANSEEIERLRSQGASWRAVGTALGVSAATAFCASARFPFMMKLKNAK